MRLTTATLACADPPASAALYGTATGLDLDERSTGDFAAPASTPPRRGCRPWAPYGPSRSPSRNGGGSCSTRPGTRSA